MKYPFFVYPLISFNELPPSQEEPMKKIKGFPVKIDLSSRKVTRIMFFLTGLVSSIWFLIRVIPRPSRAAYPCQRVAFPIAAAFVIWLSGIVLSSFIYVKAKINWRKSQYRAACLLCFLAIFVFIFTTTPFRYTHAMAVVYNVKASLFGSSVPPMRSIGLTSSSSVEPTSVVGAVKSSVANAEDIEAAEILSMVREAVERAGGLESVVSDGDTVILKPNLISFKDFTASQDTLVPEVNGIATDYRVIQAVVDVVREVNPTGEIYLMEGSGVGITSVNMSIVKWDEVTGLDSVLCLEDICGGWFDSTSVYLEEVSLPPGKALYNGADNRYWLNKLYLEADVLISLPVLKNHQSTGSTGAVKNVGIGATPPTIYGLGPQYQYPYERSESIDHGEYGFPRTNLHNWIHDYYMCRPVDFVIMDGLQGIQNGPLCHYWLNYTNHISQDQMNMRLILASGDPISIDAIAALLEGHDPALITHLVTLHNDSLGCNDPRLIRVNGIKVGDEKKDFEINDSGDLSKYTDFQAPTFSVDSCYLANNEIHFNLTVDEEVNKVEVAIEGSYLDRIVVEDFDHFFFDLDTLVVDETTEIVVYAYDRYLNYSSRYVNPFTAIGDGSGAGPVIIPHGFSLHHNYPNPFNPQTTISYTISEEVLVNISVYDMLGRKVETLVNKRQGAGYYRCTWNPKDAASGISLYRLQAGDFVETRKMTLLK
jgi:uncharacterized protein (DUF362 family)